MKTEVYFNLHKKLFSIRQAGKVVMHLPEQGYLVLVNVKFTVQPAGRNKVLKERRKNVHAFIRGEVEAYTGDAIECFIKHSKEVTYNPYKMCTFYLKDTGEAVTGANTVILNNNKAYALDTTIDRHKGGDV